MSTRLKNILSFTVTPGGGSVSLPHGLIVQNGRPVKPDFVIPSLPGFTITADDTNVTVSGDGTVDVLVEAWHSIERVFGDKATLELTPQPFIAGGSTSTPTPPFAIGSITIYARMTGSDATGTGTLANPYRTFQRAVRDVPSIIPPLVTYFIDITGVGGVVFDETLPPNYTLPAWKAPQDILHNGDAFFNLSGAVTIRATPQLVASLPPADAVINVGDVLSTAQDPLTKFWTITLNVARASWGTSSPGVAGSGLKGKIAVGPSHNKTHPLVAQNTTTTIEITRTDALAYPISLMEPSAHLHAGGSHITHGALTSVNCDSIAYSGLRITSDDGDSGLIAGGLGAVVVQLCELESPSFQSISDYQVKILSTWLYGYPALACSSFHADSTVFDNTVSGPFLILGPPMGQPTLLTTVFDNSDPISYGVLGAFLGIQPASTMLILGNCRVRGSTGPGISWHGGNGLIKNCDIQGCAGAGIEANQGHGILRLENVGSSAPNGTYGVIVDDGAFVKVDADTSTTEPVAGLPLTGTTGDMKVGTLAVRTWADFVAGSVGHAAKNEYDILTVSATGATGSGSRLYEP